MDQEFAGAPVQVRVTMGKEPRHFMAIFKGKLVIFEVRPPQTRLHHEQECPELAGQQEATELERREGDQGLGQTQTRSGLISGHLGGSAQFMSLSPTSGSALAMNAWSLPGIPSLPLSLPLPRSCSLSLPLLSLFLKNK